MNNFFSVANLQDLSSVPHSGAIHVIGVCGVAMAQIAIELAEQGYKVSGSDKEFYPPMSNLLDKSKVQIIKGYSAANIRSDLDLVVIGNSVTKDNPEVLAVMQGDLKYTIFPKLLSDLVISNRHSIVVAGTHGKTTTSAIAAFLLESIGQKPSYFIGGAAKDLDKSLKIQSGGYSVVEGDEYDSAFFAKQPKFDFYRPNSLIITSVEFDHADIYRDLEHVEEQFNRLLTSEGLERVYCCIDCKNVKKLLPEWRARSKAQIFSYGQDLESDFIIANYQTSANESSASIISNSIEIFKLSLAIPGVYNLSNALAVLLVLKDLKLDLPSALDVLPRFRGVKRRQELRVDNSRYKLIEDFAHHPSAVLVTLKGLRERYQGQRLIAIFEPRSNTSRRKVFQSEYVKAFQSADLVLLSDVAKRDSDKDQQLLDVSQLAREINSESTSCLAFENAELIYKHISSILKNNDLIVVMSNGSFSGLIEKLEALMN